MRARSSLLPPRPRCRVACGSVDPCAGVAGACLAVHVTSSTRARARRARRRRHRRRRPRQRRHRARRRHAAARRHRRRARLVDQRPRRRPRRGRRRAQRRRRRPRQPRRPSIGPGEHAVGRHPPRRRRRHAGTRPISPAPTASPAASTAAATSSPAIPARSIAATRPPPPTVRGVCTYGCILRPGLDDTCRGGGGICSVGGFYCGGDKLDGDPQTLYKCQIERHRHALQELPQRLPDQRRHRRRCK